MLAQLALPRRADLEGSLQDRTLWATTMGGFKEMPYHDLMRGKGRRFPAGMRCEDIEVLLECIDIGRAEVSLVDNLRASVHRAIMSQNLQNVVLEDAGEPDAAGEGGGGVKGGTSNRNNSSNTDSTDTAVIKHELGKLFDSIVAKRVAFEGHGHGRDEVLVQGPDSPRVSREELSTEMPKNGYTALDITAILQGMDAGEKQGPQQISRKVFVELFFLVRARVGKQARARLTSPAADAEKGYLLKLRRYGSDDERIRIQAEFEMQLHTKLHKIYSRFQPEVGRLEVLTQNGTRKIFSTVNDFGKDSAAVAMHLFTKDLTEPLDVETELDRSLYYECSLEQIHDLLEKYRGTVDEEVHLSDDPFNVAAKFMQVGVSRFPLNFGPDLAMLLAPSIVANSSVKLVTISGVPLNLELLRSAEKEIDLSFDNLKRTHKGEPGLKPYTIVHAIFISEALRAFGAQIETLDLRGHDGISREGLELLADAVPYLTSLRQLNGLRLSLNHPEHKIRLTDFLSSNSGPDGTLRTEFKWKSGEWLDPFQIFDNISDLVFPDAWETLNVMEQAFVCQQVRLHKITQVDGAYVKDPSSCSLRPSFPAGRRRMHMILVAAFCAPNPDRKIKITGLALDNMDLGPKEMEELARESRQLCCITHLSLSSNPLQARGLFMLHPALM